MDNAEFLQTLKSSFVTYLRTSPRSNKKLVMLHGKISKDIVSRLGSGYEVASLGYREGKEKTINGHYIDKTVDITVMCGEVAIVAIEVKYVMGSYKQNSNDYFENMLGATANLRRANVPCFQIFVIPDKIPYFDKAGKIKHWDEIDSRNLQKYVNLSNDNPEIFMHTPTKTLLYVVHFSEPEQPLNTRREYSRYYKTNDFDVTISDKLSAEFGNALVYNDYEKFAEKVAYYIKSI